MRQAGSFAAVAAAAALLGLAGCGQLKGALGLEKRSPDEFQVEARAPLSMPPDFNLRPPQPGAARPQESAPREQAQAAVLGNSASSASASLAGGSDSALLGAAPSTTEAGGGSDAESALLQQANAVGVDPTIRQLVNSETAVELESDKQFIDRLVFWRTPAPPGQVVDPVKEQQRLQENAALGKPVTEGESPVIIRRKRALLEGIF